MINAGTKVDSQAGSLVDNKSSLFSEGLGNAKLSFNQDLNANNKESSLFNNIQSQSAQDPKNTLFGDNDNQVKLNTEKSTIFPKIKLNINDKEIKNSKLEV